MNSVLLFLFIRNLELPHQMKSDQMLANRFDLSDMKCEAPIDLSRRCDSVESRKTPSPYNSSAFGGESSPSLLNESPSSSLMRSNSSGSNFDGQLLHHNHRSAATPNRYLQSAAYIQRNFSSASTDSTKFPYESDRSPSPDDSMPLHHSQHPHHPHHRYMHDHQISMLSGNEDELNRFLHAFALQKLQNIPATALAGGTTENDSTHITTDALPFPMMLGRDGKVARPFKAYSSDPLSIAATIPASDSLIHRMSTERYNLYREEMMKKICEANGGRPTITNPKMRRTSHRGNGRSGAESDQSMDAEKQQQQQQNVASQQDQSHTVQADSNVSSDTNRNGKEPIKDSAYYERRRKNNAAAKKSRDRRRIKEDEIAIRAAFLERENLELKIELAAAKRQLASFLEK